MEKEMLRDYLERVRLLENDIYTMNETIVQLENSKREVPEYHPPQEPVRRPMPISPNLPDLPSTTFTIIGTLFFGYFFLVPGIIFLIYRCYKRSKIKERINTLKQQHEAKVRENQNLYEKALKQYEFNLSEYEKSYPLSKKEIDFFNENIDMQVASLSKRCSLTEDALQKLYSLNIIYYKYRSIIPVTMFCEYLDSGIRDQLHGANGMYDLYEQQILAKHIVGELGTINSGLRTISRQIGSISSQLVGMQRNQALLYEEISKGNTIACEIAESTKQMISNCETHLASIHDSAAMTAFNTQVTARRTDALAKIAEYEFATKHSSHII